MKTTIQFGGTSKVRRPIRITRIVGGTAFFVFTDVASKEEGQLRDDRKLIEQLVVGKEYTIAGAALEPPPN